ncbi:MAG: DUF222 domain-containing protein [Acidimicrobiales bacterium]
MSEPTECSARVRTYRACTPAERQIAIQQLAALECATRAELADVVTAADLEEDWRADGATAMSAFVRADTDEDLAQRLQCLSSAQIDALARQHRLRTKRDARQAHAQRGFRSRPDHDFGGRRYSGFLPDAEAAQVDAVLDRIADSYGPNAETGMWDPPDMRRADALVELATQRLAEDSDPETCMVVVHADAAVIDGARAGNGSIDGMQIPAESVLRHLCDARIECSVDAPDGTTVGIGRTNRTPPRWLRRRIRQRDGCRCRFPGCDRPIRQIHHIRHWVRDHGVTDAWNLVGLCWHHHRLVHEGGWEITGNADHELTFTSPYGRALRSKPEPLRHATRIRAQQVVAVPLGQPIP